MTQPDEDRVFGQLEQMLVDAAARQAADAPGGAPAGAPRRRRRLVALREATRRSARPRSALAVLAAVLVTGTALAATQPWEPLLGNDRQGHPTPTSSPLDPAALGLLGVLRRPQGEEDRGPGVQEALRSIGDQNHGVRVAGVRLVGHAPDGRAIVLIPVVLFADEAAAPAYSSVNDALCVYYPGLATPGHAAFADYPCWTAGDIGAGKAIGRLNTDGVQRIFGLARDGVTTADFALHDGTAVHAEVHDNFFDAVVPATAAPLAGVDTVRWLDAHGDVVSPG
ncbi:MAG: hypothetical protein QOJ35_2084 [Solirubrobacteraceae bacterium]|jgi:hypothetical protein|nr:hypothetical protein [Solirubrobacteraceae bacterium]